MDPLIKSQLLYQLSYAPIPNPLSRPRRFVHRVEARCVAKGSHLVDKKMKLPDQVFTQPRTARKSTL